MDNRFIRTEMLLGEGSVEKLKNSRIAVFGVGGVGSYTVEALARSGIGTLDLIDNDIVSLSNINRQLIANDVTLGKYKVDAAKERILTINPEAVVNTFKTFYLPENAEIFDFSVYDYVVDAIDTVSGKISIVIQAQKAGTKVISSMGTGNKLNPEMLEICDIYKTSVCPLARVMRNLCRKNGIKNLTVVYSKEEPLKPLTLENDETRRQTPGSTAFVPSVAGLIIAGKVIRDLVLE